MSGKGKLVFGLLVILAGILCAQALNDIATIAIHIFWYGVPQ